VADAALTLSDYTGFSGEAMAIGERTPVAIVDSAAAARMAVGEALTNLASAPIEGLRRVKLSANWMAAAGAPGEDARLYDAVKAVGLELCPELGLTIPVGKDSMSMRTVWDEGKKSVVAPVSLIVSAFARVRDVRKALTPELRTDVGETKLVLVDLGRGKNRLGASAFAQVHGQVGSVPADLDRPEDLASFFEVVQSLNLDGKLLAYHDRSDGGLFVTVTEMAFAARTSVRVTLDGFARGTSNAGLVAALFSEELGAVLQVRENDVEAVVLAFAKRGLDQGAAVHVIGSVEPSAPEARVVFEHAGQSVLDESLVELRRAWSETSYRMQSVRNNPKCAAEEFARNTDPREPGLVPRVPFDPNENIAKAIVMAATERPKVAILREQGVNGQVEMAAAFHQAGFEAIDVHMSDVLSGRARLEQYRGLVACGGFSYGDVLGAGQGWAKSVLFNASAREALSRFFRRSDTFSLGVCNGCQALSGLKELIPGAEAWPRFVRNESEQFEARLALVEVQESKSVLFSGMAGARIPVAVAHGEGRAEFLDGQGNVLSKEAAEPLVALRFIDGHGNRASGYPTNPNGSPDGITGLTSVDGRATILMPHPERVFRSVQLSWRPRDWEGASPWMRLFQNARRWVG
jgi:phosphoribosylformylglycinamidine synthase